MIAVIFEVWPADRAAYLGIAADLAPLLQGIDGFLSIERFESLAQPGKLLSLSFWRDEAAAAAWRNLEAHRAAPHFLQYAKKELPKIGDRVEGHLYEPLG